MTSTSRCCCVAIGIVRSGNALTTEAVVGETPGFRAFETRGRAIEMLVVSTKAGPDRCSGPESFLNSQRKLPASWAQRAHSSATEPSRSTVVTAA
jgi:hypothetical protein